jgi:hypothetical protein
VPGFEELGRRLDRELERLRQVAEGKGKSATRQADRARRQALARIAPLLLSLSHKLSRLARQLGSKAAAKKSS